MLRQHSHIMLAGLVVADAVAVGATWLLSYWARFEYFPAPKGVPELSDRFLPMLPLVVLGHLLVFGRVGLYRPRRSDSLARELRDILKAFIVAVVVVVLLDYAWPQPNKLSRGFIATYAVLGTGCFTLFRLSVRGALRMLRRRGFNRRYAAIVGSGRVAQRLVQALQRHRWTGIDIAYFIDDTNGRPGQIRGIPLRGPLTELRRIIDEHPVDAVFIALPSHDVQRFDEVLAALETSMADVRFVPDVNPAYMMRPRASELDGVPILSLRQSPLYGWNVLLKRGFDLVAGTICLILAALPMGLIALLVKRSSPGPAFYRQRRIGLDGQEFTLIKFRTMRADAEAGGPVWSQKEDARRTRIGEFLRRTSLDELPNLFNVLAGHMSLVGPRPERPEFIARFRDEIPKYMQRHKMKAGMTGYAQIKGWRGDTSLRKRIQHDLYYIRNWSLGLDLWILLQTAWGVWFSQHETPGGRPDAEASRAGTAERGPGTGKPGTAADEHGAQDGEHGADATPQSSPLAGGTYRGG